jgi:DnaJ-class molecular chaperone
MYTEKVNSYQQAKLELENTRCPTCDGLGDCDDAGPGDIYFETWICPDCRGTGLKPTLKETHGYSTSK